MIFRRSLVRELTATAIALFVVLLAILFTQSVIRILGAGGRWGGRRGRRAGADRLQRHVLPQPAAVGGAVPHRAADAVPLVPGQRDGGLVHLRAVADGVPQADPAVRRALPGRHRAALALPVALGRAAQDRVRAAARVARRDLDPLAGPVPRVPARRPRRLRREHQPGRRPHPQRLPALGRRQEGRHDRGAARPPGRGGQRRPLRGAGGRPPLRRAAGFGRFPADRVRQARPAHRARRGARVADFEQGHSHCRAARRRRREPARRALLAHVGADPRARADAARHPARVRESADGALVQPHRRGIPLHALHQLHQHRAEHDRAGQDRPVARAAGAARHGAAGRGPAVPSPAVDHGPLRRLRRSVRPPLLPACAR